MPEAADFDLPRIVDQMEILLCLWSATPLPRESDQVMQLARDLADTVRIITMATNTTSTPKPNGKKAEPLTPAEQKRRFAELCEKLGTDDGETLDRVFKKIVPPKVRPDAQGSGG